MNRGILVLALCGMMGLIGCEQKDTSQPPLPRPANKPAAPATPTTMDKAKEAATTAGEKTGEAVNTVGTNMVNHANDMGMTSVKTMIDSAKTKMDELKAGSASVPADKKTGYNNAMSTIQSQYDALVKNYDASKSLTGDALASKIKDLTNQANELMKNISDTATKFGIKI